MTIKQAAEIVFRAAALAANGSTNAKEIHEAIELVRRYIKEQEET